jgi:hypothetical protein
MIFRFILEPRIYLLTTYRSKTFGTGRADASRTPISAGRGLQFRSGARDHTLRRDDGCGHGDEHESS